MHGHGYPQPTRQPPPTGWLVLLRVLFVAVSVLSFGFLTWAMMLRLAVVTRRSLDWGLFVAVLAADILAVVLIGSEPGEEIHTNAGWTGLTLLLGTLVAAIAYYLAADVRHFHQLRHGAYGTGQAYGYQPAPGAYVTGTSTTVPRPPLGPNGPAAPGAHGTPVPPGAPLAPRTPPPMPGQAAAGPPPAHRPAAGRIDQVRAELDELSNYLRNQDGQDGRPQSGR